MLHRKHNAELNKTITRLSLNTLLWFGLMRDDCFVP